MAPEPKQVTFLLTMDTIVRYDESLRQLNSSIRGLHIYPHTGGPVGVVSGVEPYPNRKLPLTPTERGDFHTLLQRAHNVMNTFYGRYAISDIESDGDGFGRGETWPELAEALYALEEAINAVAAHTEGGV